MHIVPSVDRCKLPPQALKRETLTKYDEQYETARVDANDALEQPPLNMLISADEQSVSQQQL